MGTKAHTTMSARVARRWLREHWATLIANADLQIDVPAGVADIFADECQKIAARLRK